MLVYETAARNRFPGIISTSLYYADEQANALMRGCAEIGRKYHGETFFVKLWAGQEALKERATAPYGSNEDAPASHCPELGDRQQFSLARGGRDED